MGGDDDAIEAIHREIIRSTERQLGRPFAALPIEQPDSDYNQLEPWLADWWRGHPKAPTLVLRCGISDNDDECHKKVGEVKAEGHIAIALMFCAFGESIVAGPTRNTEQSLGFPPGTVLYDAKTGETLAEQYQRRLNAFNQKVIRQLDEGRYITKRDEALPTLMTLDFVSSFRCPIHGTVALPDPTAVVSDIRAMLQSQQGRRARKWQYVLFH